MATAVEAEEILKRIERLEHLLAILQGELGGHTIQAGTIQLAAGTSGVIPAIIASTSRIIMAFATPNGGANNNTAKLAAPTASRVNTTVPGTGSFVIEAHTVTDVVNNTDTSTVDYVIVG